MKHLHRCRAHRLGGWEERCQKFFECEDDCLEDDQETLGFCEEHEKLVRELEAILTEH